MNEKKIYTVEGNHRAKKDLSKIDLQIANKIYRFVYEEIALDPYKGKRLEGELRGLFSYRYTRSYRIIYDILEDKVLITIVKASHRKNVYD